MFYPAIFTKEENGFTVTFPDIPEAITCGSSLNEAQEMAEDVLLSCVEIYFDMDKVFPHPSNEQLENSYQVFLPDSIYAKILLNNEVLKQKMTKADLSRLTGITPQEIQRVLKPRHTTKIDTISKILAALGKRINLSVC